MPSSSALIDHLIAVGNKSGVIPGGPNSVKGLKESINSIPFSLSPGVSAMWPRTGGLNLFSLLGALNQIATAVQTMPRGVPAPPPRPTQNSTPSTEPVGPVAEEPEVEL